MKIKDNIKEILKQGVFKENMYFLPDIKLDRKDYIECNSILETIGLKWNKGKKAHIPTEEIEDLEGVLNDILENGEVETLKEYTKRFQFYHTPKEIAKYLVDKSDIQENDIILEPSAGEGHIVDYILPKLKNNKHKYVSIVLNELNNERRKFLQKKYNCFESLKYEDFGGTYSSQYKMNIYDYDFLNNNFNQFEKIIMNPPFSKKQDYKHIKKAIELLKDGGRLVGIMSKGILFREDYKDLKDDILEHGYIEELDKGIFKDSGTMIGTCIIVYNK